MSARVQQYAATAGAIHGLTAEQVLGRSRDQVASAARQTVMRRLRADGFSLAQIGRMVGRHHTTVLHATRKHA